MCPCDWSSDVCSSDLVRLHPHGSRKLASGRYKIPPCHYLHIMAEDFKGRRPNEAHTTFPLPTNNHPSSTRTRTHSMTTRQGHQRPAGAAAVVAAAAAVQADNQGESGGIQDGITDRAAVSRREPSKLNPDRIPLGNGIDKVPYSHKPTPLM